MSEDINYVWWITVVELPVIGSLFWLLWRNRRDGAADLTKAIGDFSQQTTQMREALSAYKLEVAKSYASIAYIQDVEKRLVAHLERIEKKLDADLENRRAR